MGVTAGAHRIGKQHAIQPAVDDAVSRSEGDAAAGHNKIGQRVLSVDINGLGIGRRMAERLHREVGREAQAGQILQLVACHRASSVLRADGGHAWLAVCARSDSLDAASASHHFLRQRVAFIRGLGLLRFSEEFALA